MDNVQLQRRLETMSRYPNVDPTLVRRFGAALTAENDWGLFRINPLRFAARHGLPPDDTLDLFVIGAREALFDLAFLQVCTACGRVTHRVGSWGGLAGDSFACRGCRIDVRACLDGPVAVCFSIADAVRPLELDHQKDRAHNDRYHLFSEFRYGSAVKDYFSTLPAAWLAVERGASTTFGIDTGGQTSLIVDSYDADVSIAVPIDPNGGTDIDIVVNHQGIHSNVSSARPGWIRVTIHNHAGHDACFRSFVWDHDQFRRASVQTPPVWRPFVNARDLLSLQRFRDLYRVTDLPADLRLRIESLTVLFTDLSGSTALYDAVGDVTAFDIVREHFEVLTSCVRRHRGAIVKTMGDAIMASFPRPDTAVAAARDMVEAMRPVSDRARRLGHTLELKVGIHEGPALVINADDRLDYFGQTVNVAARVQGLAAAGEVWLTRRLFDAAGTILTEQGFAAENRRVPLKGVEDLVDVVRLTRAA